MKKDPQNSWSNISRTQFSRKKTILDSSVTSRWRTLILVWVLYVLVCDRTIKRCSRVSNLTQIDLALEMMHICSIQSKTTQKNSKKYLEKQEVEERINPKSTQLKSEKYSSTGYTGGRAPVLPKATGYTGALSPVEPVSAARIKVENISITGYTGVQQMSTGLFTVSSLREHVFGGDKCLFSTSYTGGLILDHQCIHSGIDQRLCSWNSRKPFSTSFTGAS